MKLDKRWNGPRVTDGAVSMLCDGYLDPGDGAMCCIGVYGMEKGFPVEDMLGKGDTLEVENFPNQDIFEREVDFGEVCAVLWKGFSMYELESIEAVLREVGAQYAQYHAGEKRTPYVVQTPIITINDSENLDLPVKAKAIKILFLHFLDEEVDISEYTKGA